MCAFYIVKDNELLRVSSDIGIAADDVALQAFALVVGSYRAQHVHKLSLIC